MLKIKHFNFQQDIVLEIPADAKVLDIVSFPGNQVFCFVMLDPKKPLVKRKFISIQDNESFMDLPMNYICSFPVSTGEASVQMQHVFELLGNSPKIVAPGH